MKAVILVSILFLSTTNDISFCHGNSRVMNCIESERQALLTFKQHLTDPSNRLSSWALDNNYCCKWVGVVCDNLTAHVKELHLQNPYSYETEYEAYKRSSLGGKINSSLMNLKHLSYLDLSNNDFGGIQIPNFIGSLGSLRYLIFSSAGLSGMIPYQLGNLSSLLHLGLGDNGLNVENLQWIFGLSSLEHLDLSSANLSKASDWLQVINMLPSLIELHLSHCQLDGNIPPPPYINFTSLSILDLSYNYFNSTIPNWLYSFSHLESLTLSVNGLHGMISSAVGNLASLTSFDLSQNQLEGAIPSTVGNLASLTSLNLSHNQLEGAIPRSLENLCNLEKLDLSNNKLFGPLPNQLGQHMYLSSNQLSGPLPHISSDLIDLDISNNSFSGNISHFLCDRTNESNKLQVLDLEKNLLSGEIPDCWVNWQSLHVIKLEDNNFTGKIPSSLRYLRDLRSLHLRNNSLSGEIPSSLQNCTSLTTLDLSLNEFKGSIPTWMGINLSDLSVLILRSNKFNGKIPLELCHLSDLHIMDLAENNLSGTIPHCFSNLKKMARKEFSGPGGPIVYSNGSSEVVENAFVVTKGREFQYYAMILSLVASLDLSSNNLSGEVPKELTSLLGLFSLNLSNNHLIGRIPDKIGNMELLESLDFSRNQFFGEIPPSISNLTFLSHLDLSYNNLSGKIPLSTQLQSLNASSFVGNQLCGPPLTENCSADGIPPNAGNGRDEGGDGFRVKWFYLSMMMGFVVGFWSVCGPLLFNKSWRCACFRFLDQKCDNLYYRFYNFF